MFVDGVDVLVEAGHGGAGRVSFGKMRKSGPDGGNGGKGGDIYFKSSSDLTLLNQFTSKTYFKAQDGEMGGRMNRTGKKGKDTEIVIPVGTSIIEKNTGWTIFEFTEKDQLKLICKGGIGGKGNTEFKSSRNTTPMNAQKGLPGEKFEVTLNLKLIADFGLIGLPNAGKSSLLNELTKANAKVGNYSFTTLSPNIGVMPYTGKILADIPGLVEGASNGKGLGIKFLKHIEKVKVLIHCISAESNNFEKDYKTVRNELKSYGSGLDSKKEIILITKSDLINVHKKFKSALYVSIYDFESLKKLKKLL